MDRESSERLKQRHEFKAWSNQNRLPESLFVQGFFVDSRLLDGWQLLRETRLRETRHPVVSTIWRSTTGGDEDHLLRIDFRENASRLQAHEAVLKAVGEFESPFVERQAEETLGDVCFVVQGGRVVVFARANLVFIVVNLGANATDVKEIAKRLDKFVFVKPADEELTIIPATIDAVGGAAVASNVESTASGYRARIGLRLPTSARQRLIKFFSSSGEVFDQDGQIVCESDESGKPDVTVYAQEQQESGSTRTYRFKME